MNKNKLAFLLFVFIVTLAIINPFAFSYNELLAEQMPPLDSTSKTLYVGEGQEYQTIQSAVDASSEGDTIIVKSGTYNEKVVINKNSITLKGEGYENTVIDTGDDKNPVIKIYDSMDINIEQLTLRNGKSGIDILYSSSILINQCKVETCKNSAIYCDSSSEKISILESTLSGCTKGVDTRSSHIIISTCSIYDNNDHGIFIYGYYNNNAALISENEIFSNRIGCYITAAQFIIEGNKIFNNAFGINLYKARTDNPESEKREILNNQICFNSISGIDLFECSKVRIEGNYICKDTISLNEANYGINDLASEMLVISKNTVSNYTYGIAFNLYEYDLDLNQDNLVYQNDFIDNGLQALDDGTSNSWSYEMLGNHWSDYKGQDANGDNIGDIPYVIKEGELNICDNYPVMSRLNTIVKPSPIITPTSTPTPTPTITVSPTPSNTPTPVPSAAASQTPTNTVISPSPVTTAKTLYVGEGQEYQTIQSAVDASSEGDTIVVKSGIYKENVSIKKNSITLKGEGYENTFIDTSDGKNPIIRINESADVNIEQLTLRNGKSGIEIENSSSILINQCNIEACGNVAVYCDSYSKIITISECTLSGCDKGAFMRSSHIIISNCRIFNNKYYGIYIYGDNSAAASINENEIFSNRIGCHISVTQFVVEGNKIFNNFFGINLHLTKTENPGNEKRELLNNEIFFNSSAGIDLFECSEVHIEGNYIYTSKDSFNIDSYGITGLASWNLVIAKNIISNYAHGIAITPHEYNKTMNQHNLVYQNDLIDNYIQAVDEGTGNSWSYNTQGNYWSDYEGDDVDGDNIGDTPYVIKEGDIDLYDDYPIMSKQYTVIEPSPIIVPTNTPTPTPTITLSPTPTNTPTPTPTISLSPTKTPTPTPTNTPTLPPTYSSAPTSTATASPTPTKTPAHSIQPVQTQNNTIPFTSEPNTQYPGAIVTPITPTPSPTQTPSSTPLPAPTSSPSPKTPKSTHSIDLKDIDNHWGYEHIQYVSSLGIMEGKGNKLFSPDDFVTRAECATVLIKIIDGINEKANSIHFKDIDSKDWYYRYIVSAYNERIMIGYSDNTFRPNTPITREDLVVTLSKILTKYYGFNGIKALDRSRNATTPFGNSTSDNVKGTLELPFDDTNKISSYALDSVATAVNYGLIRGKNGNMFDPKGKATRAELAAILSKLLMKYGYPSYR